MDVSFLAYGFDISNSDSDDAATLLLTAAHAESRFTSASSEGWLDGEATRDSGYQLSLLGLFLEDVGDGHTPRFVLASYLQCVEPADEPLALLPEPPAATETDNLRWAARILKVPDDEAPAWMLGTSGIG